MINLPFFTINELDYIHKFNSGKMFACTGEFTPESIQLLHAAINKKLTALMPHKSAGYATKMALLTSIIDKLTPLLNAHKLQPSDITLLKIRSDANGNPRYVCSFFHFLTENEKLIALKWHVSKLSDYEQKSINVGVEKAYKRARSIGGKKYTGKDFGGGIVFQWQSPNGLKQAICNLVNTL